MLSLSLSLSVSLSVCAHTHAHYNCFCMCSSFLLQFRTKYYTIMFTHCNLIELGMNAIVYIITIGTSTASSGCVVMTTKYSQYLRSVATTYVQAYVILSLLPPRSKGGESAHCVVTLPGNQVCVLLYITLPTLVQVCVATYCGLLASIDDWWSGCVGRVIDSECSVVSS